MDVVRTDVFLILGDSLSDPAFTFQMWLPTIKRITGFYNYAGNLAPYGPGAPTYPSGGLRAPIFINCAVTSQTTNEILAGLTANLALNPGSYTGLLVMDGINDAAAINNATMTLLQFTNNVTSIVTQCQAAGIKKMMWVGPLCDGEKYPSGQNGSVDTAIDSVDSTLATLIPSFATSTFFAEYVPLRGPVYGKLEPQLNTLANGFADPPGLANGPLCTPVVPPGVIPGLHPNGVGRMYCTQQYGPRFNLL